MSDPAIRRRLHYLSAKAAKSAAVNVLLTLRLKLPDGEYASDSNKRSTALA